MGTLTGINNPVQSGHENNGNEEALHIPQISKTGGTTIGCSLVSHTGHSFLGEGVLPF